MTAVPPLTWLYAPGDRPEVLAKALASAADVVIADLEDAVASDRKDAARAAVAGLAAGGPAGTVAGGVQPSGSASSGTARPGPGTVGAVPAGVDPSGIGGADAGPAAGSSVTGDTGRLHVRINALDGPHARRDVEALAALPGVAALRLPKVTDPAQLATVTQWVRAAGRVALPLYPLIESALGVQRVFAIASAPGVAGIALGETDLAADLGVGGDAGLAYARGRLVVAARAAGLPSPAQSVYTALRDDAGLAASCVLGRELGFLGRAAIHPRHLAAIVAAYRPTAAEVERARAVARAAETDGGALALPDGTFVDAAVVAGARRTLAVATRHGTR